VLGPKQHLETFTREGIVAFRERRWTGSRGGAFVVGNVEHLPAPPADGVQNGVLGELFGRFPELDTPGPFEPAPGFALEVLVEERDSNQSHLRMTYRPQIDGRDAKQRAALSIYSTLLGGSMGSPVRRDPRTAAVPRCAARPRDRPLRRCPRRRRPAAGSPARRAVPPNAARSLMTGYSATDAVGNGARCKRDQRRSSVVGRATSADGGSRTVTRPRAL